jgi:hypothetical protein
MLEHAKLKLQTTAAKSKSPEILARAQEQLGKLEQSQGLALYELNKNTQDKIAIKSQVSPTSEKDRIEAANHLNTFVEKSGLKDVRDGLNSLNDFRTARQNKLSGVALLDFIAKAEKQGSFNERMVDLAMSGMGVAGTYEEKLRKLATSDYAQRSVFLGRLETMLKEQVTQKLQNSAPAIQQLETMARNSGLDHKAFFNVDSSKIDTRKGDKRLR